MNRRHFLQLLATGVIGHTLDIDRLLWVPGQKTIFIPSGNPTLTVSQIVESEMNRILPKLIYLFERDDIFYRALVDHKGKIIARE